MTIILEGRQTAYPQHVSLDHGLPPRWGLRWYRSTHSEIQAGRWGSDEKIDPGRSWVMLNAYHACFLPSGEADPACADGFSQPVPVTVPKPKTRYSVSAKKYRFLETIDLRIVAKPLGERRGYKLCYPTERAKRKRLSGLCAATTGIPRRRARCRCARPV